MNKINKCINTLCGILTIFGTAWATTGSQNRVSTQDNFQHIYQNEHDRSEFYPFLTHVFSLYPAEKFHQLLESNSREHSSDKDIYLSAQKFLHTIKPFLGDVTYTRPALAKQKQVLSDQTKALLPKNVTFSGYCEIGTAGRYYDALKEKISLSGPIVVLAEKAPSYSLSDIIDRGQISKVGTYISFNDYRINLETWIAPNSIDLVTLYIGIHHCPIEHRERFLQSIHKIMRPGGFLIIRDHNVVDEKTFRMASLAHDVFNLGTYENWESNAAELRNFLDIKTLNQLMIKHGFTPQGDILYQAGDPTFNALMLFRRQNATS